MIQGWREQFDRMLRAHDALVDVGGTNTSLGSDEARDRLYRFFQEAYALKDWVKNDPAKAHLPVEKAVTNIPALGICADISNGTKHRVLTKARTGDLKTAVVSQGVTIGVPAAQWVVTRAQMRKLLKSQGITRPWRLWLPGNPFRKRRPLGPVPSTGGYTSHHWEVESSGTRYDALTLAGEVVDAWTTWLRSQALI